MNPRPILFGHRLALLLCVLWSPGVLSQSNAVIELTDVGRGAIRGAFQKAMDDGLIAGGSLLLLHHGQLIFNEAYGYAELTTQRPFTTDTAANLASTSKPHTSTLIMTLVEDGLIDLDEPVSTYVPEMRGIKLKETGEVVTAPTMRQLLSHTAGFEALSKAGYEETIELVFVDRNHFGDSADAIAENGLAYRPGTDYRYGQLGMAVAAHVAETVTGKGWETLYRERLAGPLEMKVSSWYPDQSTIDAMATRYNYKDGRLIPAAKRNVRTPPLPIDPAASLVADMRSVARLFQLHENLGQFNGKRVLSEESVREMHRPQPAAPGYGLGLNLSWLPKDGTGAIVNHGGANGTMAWADLETGVVGVIFTQTKAREIPQWRDNIYGALHEAGVGRMVDVLDARRAVRNP
ncbi:MAG: serine hydrolase domain-containing protein [Planctomycetota bacterium]